MLQWKRLLLLEEFENERLPKIGPAAVGKMRLQEYNKFTYLEAIKSYCEEMKKTFNLHGCSCT